MTNPLVGEFKFYLDHQDELVKQYRGKHVVIKGRKVIGSYDDAITAVRETEKDHKLGTFLVQKVERGRDAHTHVFHSRVALDAPTT